MIVDKNQMIKIEKSSTLDSLTLMRKVGATLAKEVQQFIHENDDVLILCGKGNNGGDGLVIANHLEHCNVHIYMVDGEPSTDEAKTVYEEVDSSLFITKQDLNRTIKKSKIIIDAIYGFSFNGNLHATIRKVTQAVNASNAFVISIDINSGAECDTGHIDNSAIHSHITYAIDCYKPFHMLQKDHHLFESVKCIPMDLNHPFPTTYPTLDVDTFFSTFPKKKDDAYKGTYGKTLLIGGSYGMAGAISLNITGAKTVGSSYINVALPEEVYQIAAIKHTTAVFHPFSYDSYYNTIFPLISQCKAIGFGSGATKMPRKIEILDLLLQNATVPVVLDAEALRLLHQNTWILRFRKCPVILTPHIGEFAYILNKPIETILDGKMTYAKEFAMKYKVYVVLKGPHTIVASPNGECYINQSGNQALAQAGTGDILTGMITSMLTFTNDVYQAVCNAVWLHGYICDYGKKYHSMQNFPLEEYPKIMDEIFKSHGY